MKTLFTFLLILVSLSGFAQELGCGTVSEPFDISDSTEVARKAPFKFDSAESLMYLKRNGYKLKEDYLEKVKKETPEIYERFNKKEIAELKRKGKPADRNDGLLGVSNTQ